MWRIAREGEEGEAGVVVEAAEDSRQAEARMGHRHRASEGAALMLYACKTAVQEQAQQWAS